ncbi:twin-arginine translocase subunit TatB [Pseudomonas sp. S75]|uniref:Sec-independent protein translocase protein TatB n=1 Tax=unclassified Pseudomonas TaxID=196821 RepID=UPI001906F934|nr:MULTISPECIES: Sec-independent protein translocase protein TatB [unclassified Pseudomonas]MBJ9976810.1 twin-arginine translocase subunit TatB [Pseudomonas sp. S30]MBK0153915.1 twin-arginine translocase subunit TatB [Pseudomonas sp. S75]
MFEVGFSELLLVSVVALLVLGPERLPVALRSVGRGVGQARRAMGQLRAQVEREMDLPGLDEPALRQLERDIRQGVSLDDGVATEHRS